MPGRLLLLILDPALPPPAPRVSPIVLLPLPEGRAAVPLGDEPIESVLADLLASGLPIRGSRLIESS